MFRTTKEHGMATSGSPDDAVRTCDLRKAFRVKNNTVEAVSGIDLTVAAGQIFGFLGPNGAGNPVTELRRSSLARQAGSRMPGRSASSRIRPRVPACHPGPKGPKGSLQPIVELIPG
jgi:hypothetical protein